MIVRTRGAEAKNWRRAANSVDMTLSDWMRRTLNHVADGLEATKVKK